jgi:hypothetical protein
MIKKINIIKIKKGEIMKLRINCNLNYHYIPIMILNFNQIQNMPHKLIFKIVKILFSFHLELINILQK